MITTSPNGVVELCAKGGSGSRFVVSLPDRTCSYRVWQGLGIPCKHEIAYITSILGEKLEDHMDDYFSVNKFRVAYRVPSLVFLTKACGPTLLMVFSCTLPVLGPQEEVEGRIG